MELCDLYHVKPGDLDRLVRPNGIGTTSTLRLRPNEQCLGRLSTNLLISTLLILFSQIHQRGVQVLFAVTFTMSLSMFELIIFEILGVMDLSSRLFHWKLNLYFALVLLIVVLPMYMSYIVLNSLRYIHILP